MTFRTWADDGGIVPPAQLVDRGSKRVAYAPPRCCSRDLVAADSLVFFGDVPSGRLQQIIKRLPQLEDIATNRLYLCDACRSTIEREGVLVREEAPRSRPMARG